MKPYLNIKDLIVIKKSDRYKINDIVTYKTNDGSTITHRIISINHNEIITKGDANSSNDFPITKDKIIGKLILRIHNIDFIDYILSKPFFWIMLFIIGILITILLPDNRNKERS